MQKRLLRNLTLAAMLLALTVILLGAWTRLSDAGLGCPDWPGCYGHYTVPQDAEHIAQVEAEFGEKVVAEKAWPEMIHRYFASGLGLLILIIFVGALLGRKKDSTIPIVVPSILLPLVIFQGLLGMWTVTLKVHPFIVMSHLLGGFTTLSLLFVLFLQLRPKMVSLSQVVAKKFKALAFAGLVLVVLQIALGGWTASNYAATACAELPVCNSGWTDNVDFAGGFDFWQKGFDFSEFKNYEGGVLNHQQKTAIHVSHRFGAYLVFIVLGLLAILLMRERDSVLLRHFGRAVMVILLLQMGLGVSNIVFSLPLFVAVAHNGGGAILLLALIATNYLVNWQFLGKQRGSHD